MSDSTDNTTELDSYGVWVKRPGTTEDPVTDSLDSDIFDIPDMAADDLDLSDFDTEISEVAEEPVEEVTDEFSLDDLEIEETPSIEEIPETAAEAEESDSMEEIDVSDFELPEEDGEISLDEFMDEGFSDESVASGNNGFAPGEAPVTESVSLDEFSDGELSLDDFLDGGDFSTGPAPEVKPQQEEIVDEKPLEMDISFDSSVDTIETEDNIQTDETFDDEDDFVADDTDSFVHDGATHSTEVFGDTEEIDLSDFGIDADAEETPITQNVEESKMKDKVVDFDLCVSDEKIASAPIVEEVKDAAEEEVPEETVVEEPVAQEAPVTEAVVQAVPQSNENTALLQQIISELSGMKAEIDALKANLEQIQTKKEEPVVEEEVIPETAAEESSGFFDDTDGDDTIALSGDELDNMLNSVELSEEPAEEPVVEESVETEEIVEEEPVVEETVITEEPVIEETIVPEEITEEPVIEETAVEEPVVEETAVEETEIEIPETSEDDSMGFFDDTDGDDTIALSGDELDNMLSGVELSEASDVTEETPVEEEILEDISEETIIEEEIDDIPEEIDIEPVPTETVEDDIFGAIDESEDEEPYVTEETENFIEETVIEDSDEILEEPDLDDIGEMNFEETEDTSEELPEEISISKTDDIDSILVESSNDDFMNSVVDTTEEDTTPVEDFDEFMKVEKPVEESLTDSNIDYLSEEETLDEVLEEETEVPVEEPVIDETVEITEEPAVEETEEEPVIEDDFPSVDFFTLDEPSEENSIISETPAIESEPEIEETEVIEEAPVEEEIIETAVSEEEVAVSEPEESTEDAELKKDIKSVLLYMDQLLENLPEEKIVEFAKSEEFATYKKLFTELGLDA